MLRDVKVHVATSDFGQMGNPFPPGATDCLTRLAKNCVNRAT